MRIHGVHFQGIRAPQGEHRIAFDPGYNVAIAGAPGEARALLHLLEALLYPSPDRIRFARAGQQLPRAGLSFSFGADAYRVILDFEKGRLLLGRYESGADTWQRLTTDAAETSRALADLGLPSREDFERLHLLAAGSPEGEPAKESTPEHTALAAQPAREPKPQPAKSEPAPRWRDQELERAKLEARLRILRTARERYLALEREEKQIASELEKRSVLADGLDELDVRLERFRTQSDARGEELSTVEASRRALLNERARLAGVPQAQMPGMWLGVALGAAAALAGSLVAPAFYVLGVVGAATALFGLLIARSARRRMGRVEARLAALRVRETSIERRFESETGPVRSLVRALELDSIDEIQREATDYRGLLGRAEAIRRDLDEARVAFPAEAEEEIQQLERRIDEPVPEVALVEEVSPGSAAEPSIEAAPLDPEPGGASEKAAALQGEEPFLGEPSTDPRTPFLAESAKISLEPLLRAAQKSSSRPESEIREALRPVLPIYLRAITGGLYTRAWYHPGDGWHFRREGEAERVPFRDAPPGDRARVATAFRLALLETLAPGLRVPLVVGPGLDALDQDERTTLARAIARVGAAVQVIQCAADEHWAASAGSVYRLST